MRIVYTFGVMVVLGIAISTSASAKSLDALKGAFKDQSVEEKVEKEPPPIPSITPVPRPKFENVKAIVEATEQHQALPPYPEGAVVSVGKNKRYTVGEEDTMIDISRHFKLGYIELMAANQGVDPWTPTPGSQIIIPRFKLLPRAKQEGIVVNLAQMRLYYFKNKDKVVTFPIGIGREGLNTPQGETVLANKRANPTWIPTKRMREEKEWLPSVIPAGENNPLGLHALYLGWAEYLIHGSNKPWAIGRRVSSGCMRMYPENVEALFDMVSIGIPVTIVSQPILFAEIDGKLYLEANPSRSQGHDIEITGDHDIEPLTDELRDVIEQAAGERAKDLDWRKVRKVMEERKAYPVVVSYTKDAPRHSRRRMGAYQYN